MVVEVIVTESQLVPSNLMTMINSDGAGAVVIERTSDQPCFLGWDLMADGSAADLLYCEHGGKMLRNCAKCCEDLAMFCECWRCLAKFSEMLPNCGEVLAKFGAV